MAFTGTTAAEAITYINSNAGLTTQDLLDIADRMSASSGAAKVKLLYYNNKMA